MCVKDTIPQLVEWKELCEALVTNPQHSMGLKYFPTWTIAIEYLKTTLMCDAWTVYEWHLSRLGKQLASIGCGNSLAWLGQAPPPVLTEAHAIKLQSKGKDQLIKPK